MGVSKVDFAGDTLIDLTGDTVNEQSLLSGYTAHGADGELVEGAVTAVPTTTSLAVTEEGVSALDGTVGKMLNDKINIISDNFYDLSIKNLSFNGCTYQSGGYIKIGLIVVVNISVMVSGNVASGTNIISGLPAPVAGYFPIKILSPQSTFVDGYVYGSPFGIIMIHGAFTAKNVSVMAFSYISNK